MFSNEEWWAAIDRLAAKNGITPSALARRAGLDATSFNRSKRRSRDGRARWPSTESVSKVLMATGTSIEEFIEMREQSAAAISLPLADTRQLTDAHFFGAEGPSAPELLQTIRLMIPGKANGAYALRVAHEPQLTPAYRPGALLLVAPAPNAQPEQPVIAVLYSEGFVAGTMIRNLPGRVEIAPFGSDGKPIRYAREAIRHLGRIVWVYPSGD